MKEEKKIPTLAEAKMNFAIALENANPANQIRKNPFRSVGYAASLGLLAGMSRRNLIGIIFPAMRMFRLFFNAGEEEL